MSLIDTATVNGLKMGAYGTTPIPEGNLDTRVLQLHWAKCPNPYLCYWTIWDLGYITANGGFGVPSDSMDATVDVASIKTKTITIVNWEMLWQQHGGVFERTMTIPEDITGGFGVAVGPGEVALYIDGIKMRLEDGFCAKCFKFRANFPKGEHAFKIVLLGWAANVSLAVNLAKETAKFSGVSKLQVRYTYGTNNPYTPHIFSLLNINLPIPSDEPPPNPLPSNPPSDPPADIPGENPPPFPYWILIPVGLGVGIGLHYLWKHH